MFLTFFENKSYVKVYRKIDTGEVDDFGRPIVTKVEYTYPCVTGSPDVNLSLDSTGGKIHTSDLRLYLPAGTVILDGDIFVIKSKQYELAGAPIEVVEVFSNNFMVPPVVVELVHSSYVLG